ncbi:MAG TPA: hypothetical protein VK889_00870 [Solirubrobacterales bacterium]|nr:hypothetical protein [Solirubrobacterales bacterium]
MRRVLPVFPALLIMLVASLGLGVVAHASPARPAALAGLFSPPEEQLGDDEEELEEIEWEDEEEGEGEEDEWEEWEEGEEPPVECLLRSASGRAVVPDEQDKLLLTIRYSAFARTEAAVDYRLRGAKGSLHLPQSRQRLGERGVIRIAEPLSQNEAARARAARDFTVQIRIAGTPKECLPLSIRRLTIKRSVHDQLVWRQAGSVFGGE